MKPQMNDKTDKRDMPATQGQNLNADQPTNDIKRQPSEYEETAPERRQRPTDAMPEGSQKANAQGPGTRKPAPQGDDLAETEQVIGDQPETPENAYEVNQPVSSRTH